MTALIVGDKPISQTAGPGVINATMNGSDTVMIAGGNVTLDYWMLSRPEVISWDSSPQSDFVPSLTSGSTPVTVAPNH